MAVKPAWLDGLMTETFFGVCGVHENRRKNEKNVFCLLCCLSICPHCLPSHRSHPLLQVLLPLLLVILLHIYVSDTTTTIVHYTNFCYVLLSHIIPRVSFFTFAEATSFFASHPQFLSFSFLST